MIQCWGLKLAYQNGAFKEILLLYYTIQKPSQFNWENGSMKEEVEILEEYKE
jgi:hypothetical protein